nr:hypothetical protein [Mycobacterium nebraskense]
MRIVFHRDGLADHVVKHVQLRFQRGDLAGGGLLRFGQGGSDGFQIGPDLGQLHGLGTERLGGALDFIGVVDRVVAILMVPGRIEAVAGLLECVVGLRGGPARGMKRRGQTGDLRRVARLQAPIDLPRVAAGEGDQRPDAYIAELHRALGCPRLLMQPPLGPSSTSTFHPSELV